MVIRTLWTSDELTESHPLELVAVLGERRETKWAHIGQFLEGRVFKDAAWVGLGLIEKRERDVAVFGSVEDGGFHGAGSFRAGSGWKEKRADTGWRYPLHGSELATNGLVRERFEKALQAEIVVPLQGELLVLAVQCEQGLRKRISRQQVALCLGPLTYDF